MARTLDPAETATVAAPTRRRTDWYLRLVVFVSGGVSIGIELAASRLLAPFFGTSLFIWATLIGLTLIYLSIGYTIGGRLADRHPSPSVLYSITTVAAFTTGLIPLIARPILAKSLDAFATLSVGAFYSSLIGTVILFAVPVTLLGCVSPFAIRLAVESLSGAGNTAGSLYALSTFGSIVGTFMPTFLLIPKIGTFRTFYTFALVLLVVSLLGLVRIPAPKRRPGLVAVALVLLCIMLLVASFGERGFVRPVEGANRAAIWQGESAYNFIQVVRNGDTGANELYLNEGQAIHSLYFPDQAVQPLTRGPWDYFTVAPYFVANEHTDQIKDVCVIGLAGGTAAQRMLDAYGPQVRIDGVEIDPRIVDVGRRFFGMTDPRINAIVEDGRYYLKTTEKRYDIVAVDAYKQPYIPFQLTTREFFQEAYNHLNDQGVLVLNAGRTATDFRLVDVVSDTMRSVFPNVYRIDAAGYTNTLVIGTRTPSQLANFLANVNAERTLHPQSSAVTIGDLAMQTGNVRESQPGPRIFTDDLAPVEDVIDRILIDYARKGGT